MVLDPVGVARQLTGGICSVVVVTGAGGHVEDVLVGGLADPGERVRCLLLCGGDVRPMKDGSPSRGRPQQGRANLRLLCPVFARGPFPACTVGPFCLEVRMQTRLRRRGNSWPRYEAVMPGCNVPQPCVGRKRLTVVPRVDVG